LLVHFLLFGLGLLLRPERGIWCPPDTNLLIELVAPFLKTIVDMPQLSLLRRTLLFGVALNLCLIAVGVLLYRQLLAMPGAFRFILEPVIGLIGCGLFVVAATSGKNVKLPNALWPASAWGMAGGALLVIHMVLKTSASASGKTVGSLWRSCSSRSCYGVWPGSWWRVTRQARHWVYWEDAGAQS
jgi:hypothetical protein